jgi:hypothetical protein
VATSNIGFNSGGNFIGAFDGSYDSLRGKPGVSSTQPEFFETLTFFPDKSLTLTVEKNNLISGLNLNSSSGRLSWIRANRIICTEMSVLNGPISQVGTPQLSHQPAKKGYVDGRFLAYTPTDLLDFRF